jgi:hypothetical protein
MVIYYHKLVQTIQYSLSDATSAPLIHLTSPQTKFDTHFLKQILGFELGTLGGRGKGDTNSAMPLCNEAKLLIHIKLI